MTIENVIDVRTSNDVVRRHATVALLILEGGHAVENIVVRDAVECMRLRLPIAYGLHDLRDGAQVRFETE